MLSPLAALRYFVNPRLTFGLDYRHLTYSSDPGLLPPSPSYLRNVVMLSVHGKF